MAFCEGRINERDVELRNKIAHGMVAYSDFTKKIIEGIKGEKQHHLNVSQ
jgi:hypothetical protein